MARLRSDADTVDESTMDDDTEADDAPPLKLPIRQSLLGTIRYQVLSALNNPLTETRNLTPMPEFDPPKDETKNIGPIAGYELIRILGHGGMGDVWLGQKQDHQAAIKILKPSSIDADSVARFKREAEIGLSLSHPNLIEVFDHGVHTNGAPYMIMEYLSGQNLATLLKKGPLPIALTFDVIKQMTQGLSVAHKAGLVHRDLKPHNIFIGENNTIRVLDFGISKKQNSMTIITDTDVIIGTPNYMAPEQATGQHDVVNATTDVFAIGLLMYEMFSGKRAFPGKILHDVVFNVVYRFPEPLSTLVPNLPPHIYAVVDKAMSKAQEDRFQSVDKLYQCLSGEVPLPKSFQTQKTKVSEPSSKSQANLFVTRVSGEEQPLAPLKKNFRWLPLCLTVICVLAAIAALSRWL